VSEAIASLERALGAQLILRRRNNSDTPLTPAGRALLPHARAVLDAVGKARLAVADTTHTARARIEIIANESVSTYVLPSALTALRASWPNTQFSVSVGTCSMVREGVLGGDFELGLLLEPRSTDHRVGAGPTSLSQSVDWLSIDEAVALVVFAKPTHPLTRRSRSTPAVRRADLAGYTLFMSDAAGDFHGLVRQFVAADRLGGNTLEATGTVEGVKRAVTVGERALGILPAYAVAEELARGSFVQVEVRPAPPRMRLGALLSTSRARHPAAHELLVAIRDAAAPAQSPLASVRPS
jgi:DNA-binding transcriptional LysR family regulator